MIPDRRPDGILAADERGYEAWVKAWLDTLGKG